MTRGTFRKTLSANDVGATGGHQAGVLIPKGQLELRAILPHLDPRERNPSQWIRCVDESQNVLRLRYVYYNNKRHDENGTRDEFRITYMTQFFRDAGAVQGDTFEITGDRDEGLYSIRILKGQSAPADFDDGPIRVKLRGWNRIH